MQWSTRAKPELRHVAAGLEGSDAHPAKPTQEADAIAFARCPHAGRDVRPRHAIVTAMPTRRRNGGSVPLAA